VIEINAIETKSMSAVILAGGKSTRMKEDKALLDISGVPLIRAVARNIESYFREIIISAYSKETYGFLPYRIVVDKEPGQGPLMGILCGLEASSNPVNFVIACDIPEIDTSFLREMIPFTDDYEIVVPVSGKNNDNFEPLFAFYNKSLIPRIENLLNRRIRKIIELFALAKVKYIPFEGDKKGWYHNLNTASDYKNYLASKD
jgi:molybdenum cofactor guanylyltransferase